MRKLNLTKLFSAGLYALASLVLAFAMSWVVLYQTSFFYSTWHDMGQIGVAIDKYGPQNRYRSGFGETTKEERAALFEEINQAVHHNGDGLAEITYKVVGHPEQTLLIYDEVEHLKDVAVLIDFMLMVITVFAAAWCIQMAWFYRNALSPPSAVGQSLAIISLIAVCILALLLIGPTAAFSKMHEWVFPSNSKWFFYYQQSLMSTLMHAPELFGWIAGTWAALTVLFFVVLQVLSYTVLRIFRFKSI